MAEVPPDKIYLRRGTGQIIPLSELEIETIGVGDAIAYIPFSAHQKAVAEVWKRAIAIIKSQFVYPDDDDRAGCIDPEDAIAALEAARKENQ